MSEDVSLEASYRTCRDVARRTAGNFYYSFWALPAEKRRAMCALYAFFRHTDDLSDDERPIDARRAALQSWRSALEEALAGRATDASLPALVDTVRRYSVPVEYLTTAIDGVESDLTRTQTATTAELEHYCYQVASVVGLSCVHVWGFRREPPAYAAAHRCGLAFQMTNILRDVKEDAARGRVYLPLDVLREFQADPQAILAGRFDESLRRVLRHLGDRAAQHYAAARELTPYLSDDGRRAYAAMWEIYHGLLEQIRAADYDVFSRRIRLSKWRKTAIALRHMWPRLVPFFGSRGAGSLSTAP